MSIEINESKSVLFLDLLPIYADRHAISKSHCVDENCSWEPDKNRLNAKMEAWY